MRGEGCVLCCHNTLTKMVLLLGRKQPEQDDGNYRVRQQIVVSMLEGHSLLEKELHTLD